MIRNALTRWVAEQAAKRLPPRRAPDFLIGGRADPYLVRWWLIPRNPVFNVYLHLVRRSDDDRALHDHPWASVSLMLKGRLREWHLRDGKECSRTITAGSLVYRSSCFAHRLEVMRSPGDPHGPGGEAWTVFITGPRIRQWGFHCPNGWRHWKDFTGYRIDGDKSVIGKGCE